MKRKKIITVILAISIISGMLAGCKKETVGTESNNTAEQQVEKVQTESPSDETATVAPEPVTLTIAARGGSHVDVINSVKEEFETKYNVKIEVLGLEASDLKQKVALDAANSEGSYDLVMIDDPVMTEYAESGVLLDLTQNGYTNDTDFVKQSLDIGKNPYATGDTYALPFAGNVQLLFYNQTVLDNLGATVPTNWDEVLKVAKAAKKAGQNGYVIRGEQGNPIVSDFLPILWANGGNVFDDKWNVVIESKEAKKALQLYCDLLSQGANYVKDDIVASVSDGSSAMALGWPSWFISGKDTKAAYAAIPSKISADSTVNATGMIGNWMMGVPANSTHKKLAIELLTYLTSAQVQKKAVDVGGVPTRTSVFTDSEVLTKYPYFTTIYEATGNSVVRPRTAKWSKVEEVFGAELSNVISGVKTIDEGLADAKKAIEQVMAN